MEPESGRASIVALVADTLGNLIAILRGEIALAKAELRDSASKAGSALALLAIAAVLGVVGLNTLTATLILGLIAAGMSEVAASLVVGLGVLGLAAIVFFIAKARLRDATQAPKRVADSLKRDAAAVKGQVSNE